MEIKGYNNRKIDNNSIELYCLIHPPQKKMLLKLITLQLSFMYLL